MTVQCLVCARLKDDTAHAGRGLGLCSLKEDYSQVSLSFPRECEKYLAAPEKEAKKRIAWMKKRGYL